MEPGFPLTVPEAKSLQLNEVQKVIWSLWTFPNSALGIAGERVVWFAFIPKHRPGAGAQGVLNTPS